MLVQELIQLSFSSTMNKLSKETIQRIVDLAAARKDYRNVDDFPSNFRVDTWNSHKWVSGSRLDESQSLLIKDAKRSMSKKLVSGADVIQLLLRSTMPPLCYRIWYLRASCGQESR